MAERASREAHARVGRVGKSVGVRKLLDALSHGFTEASTAIFDANVTNVIAGALMFWFGSGPIRGFAVVLMIGILTSYFTSVTVVRLMVSRWFRRTRPTELVL